jgi:hypothetical protein
MGKNSRRRGRGAACAVELKRDSRKDGIRSDKECVHGLRDSLSPGVNCNRICPMSRSASVLQIKPEGDRWTLDILDSAPNGERRTRQRDCSGV